MVGLSSGTATSVHKKTGQRRFFAAQPLGPALETPGKKTHALDPDQGERAGDHHPAHRLDALDDGLPLIERPLRIDGHAINVRARIGIAPRPSTCADAPAMLAEAVKAPSPSPR